MGLLAELMVKLYFEGNRARPYIVERITNELPRPIHPWPEEQQPLLPVPDRKAGGTQ